MSDPQQGSEQIVSNWQRLLAEVNEAATKAGREPASVRVVGVSKYVDAATTKLLRQAGCQELGESRPQALWDKAAALENLDCHWHMIGSLQRNKVRRTVGLVTLIHSVDSQRLAEAIAAAAAETPAGQVAGLVEVNISGDTNKHGFAPAELLPALEQMAPLGGLAIKGLMTMASQGSSPEQAQSEFAQLRQLRDSLREQGLPAGISLNELSMGMSGDFPQAIAEGATIIRVGSRLFSHQPDT
ncbi:YggS family pyridoxal phosphate-dependent enzyme [Planctomycetaceae bacterium SH139]